MKAKRKPTPKPQVAYLDMDLDDILNHYLSCLEVKVMSHEYFLDSAKNKVVFKLLIEE